MDNNQNSTQSNGIGFSGVLFCIFLVLKLTGVINWSWWWVTAPLWAGLALALAVILIGTILIGTGALASHATSQRRTWKGTKSRTR